MKTRAFLLAACVALAVASVAASAPADGKGKSFGVPCDSDGECASGACNKGKKRTFCSIRCSSDSQCPTPPTAGACNDRGYCKK